MNSLPEIASGSPDRFGYSWGHFNALTQEQEEQFRRWTCHLDPSRDWSDKTFLDVGCGAGRNSYWAMRFGARGGTAIDVDQTSLRAAQRNLAVFPTVRVDERSAYEIADENVYDIVFSIGVIHHLEDPHLALEQMVRAAKPGGRVLIWVYGHENMELYVRVLNPLREVLFSRLPIGLVRLLAFPATALLWVLLRLHVLRVEYFRLLRGFPFRHLHHIVFDQMLPRIANYWRREEVLALMETQGLEQIRLEWFNQMSWSTMGTKKQP